MDKSKPNTYILSQKYVCPHSNRYHMLQTLPTIIKKTKKWQHHCTADLQESATKLSTSNISLGYRLLNPSNLRANFISIPSVESTFVTHPHQYTYHFHDLDKKNVNCEGERIWLWKAQHLIASAEREEWWLHMQIPRRNGIIKFNLLQKPNKGAFRDLTLVEFQAQTLKIN